MNTFWSSRTTERHREINFDKIKLDLIIFFYFKTIIYKYECKKQY